MGDLFLVYKNITRNMLRFSLNTFAIVVAFLMLGILGSINHAFNAGIELSADDRLVTVNKVNFTQPLPLGYVNKIKSVDGVKDVTHANWFGAFVKDSNHFFAGMAVDPESYLRVYDDYIAVDEEQKKAWLANRQGAIVGEALAKVYGWEIGDRIPISSNIFSKADNSHVWDMVVEGIFSGAEPEADTNWLLFHYKYFIETQTFGNDWIGWVTLTTQDPSLNEQVAREIDKKFENSFYETETSTEKQFNKSFLEQIGNIGFIITSVVGAAFFTILLIVGNTMVLAIRERTREIAVLKTLGFSSSRIFKLVLSESMVIASFGGILGIMLSYLFVGGMRNAPGIRNMLPNLYVDSSIIVQSLIYIVILGIVTGFVPAFRAMQLNILDALSKR